jgi:hypothetical protein
VKQVSAILFGFVLAWMQIAPVPASASVPSCCQTMVMRDCTKMCGNMACCAAHSTPDSKPAPGVPAPSGKQSQMSLLALAVALWTLPENHAPKVSSTPTSLVVMATAPLYQRDCALLL